MCHDMMGTISGIIWTVLSYLAYYYGSYADIVILLVGVPALWAWLRRRARRKWRVNIGGNVAPGFEKVQEVFRKSLESGQEKGAAFSAYHKGKLVVDLWGGYADFAALRYRKRDSTCFFYSTTKAVTAIVMAMLVDRGLLDYDESISHYWPEFAQADKSDIKVKTLLCHRAGLITLDEKYKLSLIRDDPAKLGHLLAKQKPLWKPGKQTGYHALTYGLYADQIVRRVDKKHRSLAEFFKEEIAEPFEIDFEIGEKKYQLFNGCREKRATFGFKYFFRTTIPTMLLFVAAVFYSLFKYKTVYLKYLIGNPVDWKPRRLNDLEFRELPSPASHGVGTARGLARLMGILANGGSERGRRLLSASAIDVLNTALSSETDVVVLRKVTYGPGTILLRVEQNTEKEHTAFGHWGAGGQMAFADPVYQLGWAYGTNYSNVLHGFIVDHRYSGLQNALYDCVKSL